MISKSVLKPKSLASQKIRRRWVAYYFAGFLLAFLVNIFDIPKYIENENIYMAWMLIGLFSVGALISGISQIRLFNSYYQKIAYTPLPLLDERQILVRYRASEYSFGIVTFIFSLVALYILMVPIFKIPLLSFDAIKMSFMILFFFLGGLRTVLVAWLEPDPIEEAPAEIAGA